MPDWRAWRPHHSEGRDFLLLCFQPSKCKVCYLYIIVAIGVTFFFKEGNLSSALLSPVVDVLSKSNIARPYYNVVFPKDYLSENSDLKLFVLFWYHKENFYNSISFLTYFILYTFISTRNWSYLHENKIFILSTKDMFLKFTLCHSVEVELELSKSRTITSKRKNGQFSLAPESSSQKMEQKLLSKMCIHL